MKRSLRGLVVVMVVLVSAVCAWGEGSPVVLTHTLTGYSKGARTVTLEYTVQVQNRDNAPLGALTLALVPHPPFVTHKTKVRLDSLGPKAATTVNVKVVTSLLVDQDRLSKQPLLWAGKYTSANGKVVEFPVTSRQEVPNARR